MNAASKVRQILSLTFKSSEASDQKIVYRKDRKVVKITFWSWVPLTQRQPKIDSVIRQLKQAKVRFSMVQMVEQGPGHAGFNGFQLERSVSLNVSLPKDTTERKRNQYEKAILFGRSGGADTGEYVHLFMTEDNFKTLPMWAQGSVNQMANAIMALTSKGKFNLKDFRPRGR